MKYVDKSSGRTFELAESRTHFLALARDVESETLAPLIASDVFSVTPSRNKDRILILQARSEREDVLRISAVIDRLKADDRIEAVAPALVEPGGRVRYVVPGRVAVQLRDTGQDQSRALFTGLGIAGVKTYRTPGLYEVEVPAGIDLAAFIERLNLQDKVRFAEPSFYAVDDREFTVKTTVPRFGHVPAGRIVRESESLRSARLAWNLERIAIGGAWAQTRGNADVIVAIIDEPADLDHESLTGKLALPDRDAIYFTNDRSPSSHGTGVCSVVAGESSVMSGVAPGVRLLPLAVNLESQSYAERADAIRYAVGLANRGIIGTQPVSRMVLSCSWRTSGDVASVRVAIEDAVVAGVLVLFSAGNDDASTPHFPSDYSGWSGPLGEGVLSVGATDRNDAKASYSNFSPNIDVSAPGGDGLPIDDGDILCADLGQNYAFTAGTSFATPHVAALVALVLSLRPGLQPAEIKRIIRESVDPISFPDPSRSGLLGTGRINAERALDRPTTPGGDGAEPDTDEDGHGGEDGNEGDDHGGTGGDGADGGDGSPGVGTGPSIAITAADGADPSEVPSLRDALTRFGQDLKAKTGWRLTSAKLFKHESSVTIHLDDSRSS